ncbi:hypothetical protein VF12_38110 [Nostoc linckia z15]|nr:hypothetical protein VF12_38110 [Nostoc linckia z15]
MNLSVSFFNKLVLVTSPLKEFKQQTKIHDYSQQVSGSDYIFERLNEGTIGYIANKSVEATTSLSDSMKEQ